MDINEMVGFLADESPKRLAELETRYPTQANTLLKPGETMGIEDELLDVKVDTTIEFLSEMEAYSARRFAEITANLKKARLCQTSSQACAALGGSGVGIAKLASAGDTIQYLLALVAFIGAVLALVANHLSGGLDGTKSLLEGYRKLLEFRTQARQLLPQLQFLKNQGSAARTQVLQLVSQAEELCKQVRDLQAIMG